MSESFSDSVNTSGTSFSSKSSKETIKGDSLPIRSVTFTNNLNFLEEKLDIKFWLSPMPPPKIRLKTSAEKKIVQNFIHFNSSGEIFQWPQSQARLKSILDKRVTKTTRDLARDHLAPLYTPGPGTYGHDVECNRQACNKWPRMFDRPVARELRPELTPKALRTEMTDDQGRVPLFKKIPPLDDARVTL